MLLRGAQRATRTFIRPMAKKAAAPAKAKKAEPLKVDKGKLETTVYGLNILKGGTDPPILPDSEYPDWVFQLHLPRPTYAELAKRFEEDTESLTMEEQRRMIKKWNVKRIKQNNEGGGAIMPE
jgi:large subunit ribosomal protein L54|mmetsp:Transcript_23553/g.53595  ORF Transcript_23553/g.53595 Transcript_23553/m.53595 type:complete len:123 (-) Transcript_23553:309-677(-)